MGCTTSESYHCDGDTSIQNCVLLRPFGSPWTENETGIIDLTNHLPFCPCLKRKNDQGLAYVIDTFHSEIGVNRWLLYIYTTLACLCICHSVSWEKIIWLIQIINICSWYDTRVTDLASPNNSAVWTFILLQMGPPSTATTSMHMSTFPNTQFAQNVYVPLLTSRMLYLIQSLRHVNCHVSKWFIN